MINLVCKIFILYRDFSFTYVISYFVTAEKSEKSRKRKRTDSNSSSSSSNSSSSSGSDSNKLDTPKVEMRKYN